MGRVHVLEHYRPVWRSAVACCGQCDRIWQPVIHVRTRFSEVLCPTCGARGKVTIMRMSEPGPLFVPDRRRGMRARIVEVDS